MKKLLRLLGVVAAVTMIGLHMIEIMTTDPVSMAPYSMLGISVNVTFYESGENDEDTSEYDEERGRKFPMIGGGWLTEVPTIRNDAGDSMDNVSVISTLTGCDTSTFLVVLVFSTVDHFSHRYVIRHTWASVVPDSVKVVFVVGLSGNDDVSGILNKEWSTYHDLLIVDVKDTYEHLTLKSVAALHWLTTRCSKVKYTIKVDDDTTVHIPRLLDSLYHVPYSYFIMGDIIAGAQPMRNKDSKWYTPSTIYPLTTYPDYVSGSAYVISGDLIENLYSSTQFVPYFWLEDVFITGMCAGKLNASLVHNPKFKFVNVVPSDACILSKYLTVHRVQPDQLWGLWKDYVNRCEAYVHR